MRVLDAIGKFFVLILKGILWFFYGIWWVIKTIAVTIFKVIVFVLRLMVRYFFVYLPVLIMAGFAIYWILNPEGPDSSALITFSLLEDWGYEWNLTVMAAEWLQNTPTNILFLIIILLKVVVVVIAAVLEFVFVYLIFGLIGTIISAVLYLIINIVIYFVFPAAAVVYACFMIKNSESYNRWFYILCTLLTIICSVICYIYAFPAAFG